MSRSAAITIYQRPTCTTCRQVHAALVEAGVDFTAVNYYLEPLSKETLTTLLRKMAARPRDLLRTRDPIYKTLELAAGTHTDDEVLDLLVRHPDLIQRPIVERGERAVLARPAARLAELL